MTAALLSGGAYDAGAKRLSMAAAGMIRWFSRSGAAASILASYFGTGALMIFTRPGRHIGWRFRGLSGLRALTLSHQESE